MTRDKSGWVVGRVLAAQSQARGDAPFVQFEDGSPYSYRQAHELGNRVGNAFARSGVGFGDNVAVMLDNRLECIWSWIGLSRIGAVQVGINTALKRDFLAHVLNNTGAQVGVFEPEFLPALADVEEAVPNLRTVYVAGAGTGGDEPPKFERIEIRPFDEILDGPASEISTPVTYRDNGMILFTSGTTGRSKAVLMPHGHLYLFGLCMVEHLEMTPEDRYYVCMPLFHANAMLMQVYPTLIGGGSAVLARRFRASTWIDEVRASGATLTNLLGAMTDFVLGQPARPDDADNSLRMLSALPVTKATQQALRGRFGIPRFHEAFGMTECNLPVARPLGAEEEAGCSGRVWEEYFEVRIADPDTDEEVPRGEVGEILVRPKEPFCFMQGYNAMPENTVDAWRNLWFHTGDAGRMDERGFVWFIDRIRDTIRRRGENISSYEVEAVLLEHPAIAEAAAVAVKAEEGGEDEVLACLVLEPGAEAPPPEALLDFCVARMPYFAVPRYLEYVEEIPTTPTQKIQKHRLRERGLGPAAWDREVAGYKVRR